MTEPTENPGEQEAFALLERYLDDLHSGRPVDRAKLLAEHPELAGTLNCLEAIEDLAFAPTENLAGPGDPIHSAPTRNLGQQVESATSARPGDSPIDGTNRDFGDFELIMEIGRGGMGVVYKARQKSLDRLVAIKMILASHLASEDQVQRFVAEARAAAKLNHPNIVGIHEVGEWHGQHYFVMEHVEGPSLAEVLGAGPIESDAAAEYVVKIARAVHYLHEQGIVHRDLKPSNVLMQGVLGAGDLGLEGLARAGNSSLAPSPQLLIPKITDFGLAKTLIGDSHMTHTGAIVGTPSYMAPEQAAARAADVGPASDVYSLGAVLYELLTGRPPFREATPLDTLVQVLEAEPPLPRQIRSGVPRDLEMICLRCLEKSPEARYRSAAALADDLERYLKNEGVEARPPGLWHRMRRWSRRQPALSSRLGVLALCAIILQTNYWKTSGTDHAVVPATHSQVMIVLGLWAVSSAIFQQCLAREKWSEWVRFVWAATDAVLFTLVLWLTGGPESPVAIVYAALITTAGLWFRVRLVWFMTGLCTGAYAWLLIDCHQRGIVLEKELFRHIILIVVLVGLGSVVAYQVKRIRALSRYYEHRQLP